MARIAALFRPGNIATGQCWSWAKTSSSALDVKEIVARARCGGRRRGTRAAADSRIIRNVVTSRCQVELIALDASCSVRRDYVPPRFCWPVAKRQSPKTVGRGERESRRARARHRLPSRVSAPDLTRRARTTVEGEVEYPRLCAAAHSRGRSNVRPNLGSALAGTNLDCGGRHHVDMPARAG